MPDPDAHPIDLAAARSRRARAGTQLPDQVANYVRELIISGAVRPGERLRIELISEALGVSNTPVREGLLTLRTEGFVHQAPRQGFVVAPFTAQDVRDLFWVQAALAGELASRAASRISGDRLRELSGNVESYRQAPDPDEGIAELGHAFHRVINLAAQSDRLALLLGSVVRQLPNTFYASIEGNVAAAKRDHQRILAALRHRDAELAGTLMRDHLIRTGERLVQRFEALG